MRKSATHKPIPIPRDLKRGDVIVDKSGKKHTCQPVTIDGSCYDDFGRVWTALDHIAQRGQWFARDSDDTFGELAYGIIRKTSKPARGDRDAAWLLELVAEGRHKLTPSATKRLRAIARRLSGEGT